MLWLFKTYLYKVIPPLLADTFVNSFFDCHDLSTNDLCFQTSYVRRLSFGFALFHAVLACLFVPKTESGSPYLWQLNLHNGLWPIKIGIFATTVVGAFLLIPDLFYDYYSYLAMIGSAFFLLLMAILLVDAAYALYERWGSEEGEKLYTRFILGFTVGSYFVSGVLLSIFAYLTILDPLQCASNLAVVVVTVLSSMVYSVVSSISSVERGSLMVSSFVTLFSVLMASSSLIGSSTCNRWSYHTSDIYYMLVSTLLSVVVLIYNSLHYVVAGRTMLQLAQQVALESYYQGRQQPLLSWGEMTMDDSETGESSRPGSLTEVPPALPSSGETVRDILLSSDSFNPATAGTMRRMSTVGDPFVSGLGSTSMTASIYRPPRASDLQIHYNLSQFHVAFVLGATYLGMAFTNWNLERTYKDLSVTGAVVYWLQFGVQSVTGVLYLWSLIAPLLFQYLTQTGDSSSSSGSGSQTEDEDDDLEATDDGVASSANSANSVNYSASWRDKMGGRHVVIGSSDDDSY